MAWATCTEWANGDVITEAKLDAQSTAIEELQAKFGFSATSSTITPGAIAANTTYVSSGITVTGAEVGDVVLVGPPATAPSGLVYCGYVSAPDTVKIHIGNVTAGAITPDAGTYQVRVMKLNP